MITGTFFSLGSALTLPAPRAFLQGMEMSSMISPGVGAKAA